MTPAEAEAERLDSARSGDEDAFAAVVSPFRRELHTHCYLITGSLDDADEVLQDVLLAAWKGLPGFTGASSLRTWLHTIATTRSLNAVRARRRRPPIAPTPPFPLPAPTDTFDLPHLQPYPDALLDHGDPAQRLVAREHVELAFVAALQALPPRQVAALILCDVLGFGIPEAAAMLGTSATSVKGVLQRARSRMPARTESGGTGHEALARTFAEAFANDDVEAIVGLLTDSAWLAMPPATVRYVGKDAIAAFLRASAVGRPGGRYELQPAAAANRPAFVCFLEGRARGLVVIEPTTDGTAIAAIVRFLDDDLHRWFDAPALSHRDTARGDPAGIA